MTTTPITAGGQELTLAPLKSSQVAAFFDARRPDATQAETVALSLKIIAQSLTQAADPFAQGLTLEDLTAKIDDKFSWREVNDAFVKVLDITGLRPSDPGEAPAAENSTSSESTAAQ